MPLSTSSFGVVRNTTYTQYQDNAPDHAKYKYIKSFALGKYRTKGEAVTVKYTSAQPVGKALNVEYTYVFDNNLETDNVLYELNTNDTFGKTATAGFTFEKNKIESAGSTVGTIQFSSGIANRLGFEDNKTYTVDGTVYSTYPTMDREPQHFLLRVNGQDTAIIYPDSTTTYLTEYPIFEAFKSERPQVSLEDNYGTPIYIPYTFQYTYVKDYKDINFRIRGVTQYEDPLLMPQTKHTIQTYDTKEYAIKEIQIHDTQIFTGNEDMLVKAYKTYELDDYDYINTDFHIATGISTEIPDDALLDFDDWADHINKFIVYAFGKTDYVAIPLKTDGSGLDSDDWVEGYDLSSIPEIKQYPGNVPSTNTALDAYDIPTDGEPFVGTIISATAGQLSKMTYKELETDVDNITSVNFSGDDIVITGDRILSFVINNEGYKQAFDGVAQASEYFTLAKTYTITPTTPIGQRAPLYYQLKYQNEMTTFSRTQVNLIEWRTNRMKNLTAPITISSYDEAGIKIRDLTPTEFVVIFLFRD